MHKPIVHDQYYLYYIGDHSASMLLTTFIPASTSGDGIARFLWSRHYAVAAWNLPLFFPTLEQAEVLIDSEQFNFFERSPVHIGRWVSMDSCRRNIHLSAE